MDRRPKTAGSQRNGDGAGLCPDEEVRATAREEMHRASTEQQDPMAQNVAEAKHREGRGTAFGQMRTGFQGRGTRRDGVRGRTRSDIQGEVGDCNPGTQGTLGGGQRPSPRNAPSRPAHQSAGPPPGDQGLCPPSASALALVTRSPPTLSVNARTEGEVLSVHLLGQMQGTSTGHRPFSSNFKSPCVHSRPRGCRGSC